MVPRGRPIVIIDGEFDQSLSVSPNEILSVLDAGDTVLGASSMGALRATELAVYGMHGVGWVYEAYASGLIIGDDEVALVYCPLTGRALSEPLVSIRYRLCRLRKEGLLGAKECSRVLQRARRIFYRERSLEVLRQAIVEGSGAVVAQLFFGNAAGGYLEIKALDAREALGACAAGMAQG
tara:strand:+ start:32 stop:571 length:540 start_codon:yes stop_codon:yes gene_type:complete